MYIIIAIIIFGLLITIHEAGHFAAAKACGVRVSEFAVGMGPVLLKKKRGETQYSLRAFPIGGFCDMSEDEDSDDPDAFVNKSWWKRMIILVAGSAMNFLAGFLVLLFIVPNSAAFMRPVLTDFFEDCPYENADGFQVGDEFYKIDGKRVYFTSNIGMLLDRGSGDTYDIELMRDGEKILLEDYELVPVEYTIDGEKTMKYGFYYGEKATGLVGGLQDSWNCARDFVRMVWMGLGDIVSGAVGLKDLSGPVGIVSLMNDVGTSSETTSDAMFSIAYLAAFIAVNLAVMNMLPIPALDGGRIFFLLIATFVEKTTRKKVNPKYEGYIHAATMILLFGLMAVVMFSDIYKLFI